MRGTSRAPAAVAMLAMAVACAIGCKKNVDPTLFDAGVAASASGTSSALDTSTTPATNGAVAEANAASPPSDELAPLAPLKSAGATRTVAGGPATSGKTTGASAALTGAKPPSPPSPPPASAIAECDKAKQFCSHPALKTDVAIQALCTKYRDECSKKGGRP